MWEMIVCRCMRNVSQEASTEIVGRVKGTDRYDRSYGKVITTTSIPFFCALGAQAVTLLNRQCCNRRTCGLRESLSS